MNLTEVVLGNDLFEQHPHASRSCFSIRYRMVNEGWSFVNTLAYGKNVP